MASALSDEEHVQRVLAALEHQRARHAAFQLAIERIRIEPLSADVVPTFDSDAMLVDLYIEPSAMTRYTHRELEDLITRSLQHAREQMRTAVATEFARYLAPNDPLFEPDILGVPYVEIPE